MSGRGSVHKLQVSTARASSNLKANEQRQKLQLEQSCAVGNNRTQYRRNIMEGRDIIPTEAPVEADAILFRPSKKRKIYRQRATEDDDSAPITTLPAANPASSAQIVDTLENGGSGDREGASVSMAEILRLRKLRKRVGGVEFRVESTSSAHNDAGALVLADGERESYEVVDAESADIEGPAVVRRFAKQTGMIGDVDKHM
jgi:hypothetical protein